MSCRSTSSFDGDDPPEQAHMPRPVLMVEHRQGDARVATYEAEAEAALVQAQEGAAFLPVVPARHGMGRAVGAQRADDGVVWSVEKGVELRRDRWRRHRRAIVDPQKRL